VRKRAEIESALADAVVRQRALKREHRETERNERAAAQPVEAFRPSRDCRRMQRELLRQRASLRALTLARGLVAGRAYWAQERRTRRSPMGVLEALARCADVPVEEARAWLEAPVPEDARAAFELHREAVVGQARVRKAMAREGIDDSPSARRARGGAP
jgi:hypothetical protein